MNESECPALVKTRRELESIRMQLEVCRNQPDPCLSDPFGRTESLWIGRVADLEDDERELIAEIASLEELTH